MLILTIDKDSLMQSGRYIRANLTETADPNDIQDLKEVVCEGCHFSAKAREGSAYFTYHKLTDDHESEALPLCPLCRPLFHAEDLNDRFKVIFYPWFRQSEINLISNLLISCQSNPESEYHEISQLFYHHLSCYGSQRLFDRLYQSGLTSLKDLSAALITLYRKNPAIYARRSELLAGVRLLPIAHKFESEAAAWRNEWPKEDDWHGLVKAWEEQKK
jgi:hypothetical protein